ncbi:MAG: MerR family transcriptional regulator [Rhizobiales bacterium]|nr:MerR family transcriptional regulator [Hyphomicrobiales bacterium]
MAVAFIGDIATRVGISPVTIRFYEREGLISPRRIGRFRAYGAEQETRLNVIVEMRSMGLSIARIKEALERFENESASGAKESYCNLLSRHLDELVGRQQDIGREIKLTRDRLSMLSTDGFSDRQENM